MTTPVENETDRLQSGRSDTDTRRMIRGSSLLTLGRVVAIVLNFVVQVATVRLLLKADYGAFAWGIAIAAMGSSIAVFGLGRTLSRFAPMFQERREFGKMAGTVAVTLACVAAIGCGISLVVIAAQSLIGTYLVNDSLAQTLMVILILLTPLRALDSICEELFAVFARPRDLFLRRHIIGPLLKLIAVTPLLFARTDVVLLAVSYVVFGVIGTVISLSVLWSVFRKAGLLRYFRRDTMEVPARELFSFSLPLMATELLVIARTSLTTFVLEFCHGTLGVAAFCAVLPVARLNTFVADSFRFLFAPAVSRMFARGDLAAIDRIYWRTMAWIAFATYPLFIACVAMSDLITVSLFGPHYADSAGILSLLAVGFYVSSVVGFNNEILKTHGRIGRIFLTDSLTVIVAVLLNLALVPRWGASGGAMATVVVLLLRPIGNQIAVFRLNLLHHIDWSCLRLFLIMTEVTLIVWLSPSLFGNSVMTQLLLTVSGVAVVLIAGLPLLDVSGTFPELMKYRPVRRLAGVPTT